VITLSSGQGVPENWISALEAGGGNNMHQAILAATSMKLDASLTDIIVAGPATAHYSFRRC
jgi:hypothetical protein